MRPTRAALLKVLYVEPEHQRRLALACAQERQEVRALGGVE